MKQLYCILFIISIVCNTSGATEPKHRKRIVENNHEYDNNDVIAEIKFGRSLAAKILKKHKILADKKVNDYFSKLGAGVAAQMGRSELNFHFAVLDIDDINAYACPGGYIFITKGALKAMDNEAQLVGVIGHEINHVNERHVLKKLKIRGKDSSVVSSLSVMAGGSTAAFRKALEVALGKAIELLFNKGVYKKEELMSDIRAMQTLITLEYRANSYRNFIAKLPELVKKKRVQIMNKTHPSIEKRLKTLDKVMKKYLPSYDNKLSNNAKRFKTNLASLKIIR